MSRFSFFPLLCQRVTSPAAFMPCQVLDTHDRMGQVGELPRASPFMLATCGNEEDMLGWIASVAYSSFLYMALCRLCCLSVFIFIFCLFLVFFFLNNLALWRLCSLFLFFCLHFCFFDVFLSAFLFSFSFPHFVFLVLTFCVSLLSFFSYLPASIFVNFFNS